MRPYLYGPITVLLLLCSMSCAPCRLPACAPLVTDLDGQPVDLSAQRLSENPTVLVFSAVECPISNRYAPELNGIIERYSKQGVRFYLVYPDADVDSAQIRKHLQDYGYSCPAIQNGAMHLVEMSGAAVTPEAVVLSGDPEPAYRGRIDDRYVDFGKTRAAPRNHDLINALDAVLAGDEVAVKRTRAIGCYIHHE